MEPSQELLDSNKMYEELHASPNNHFRGRSIVRYLPDIMYLVKESNVQSVLDYGSGKGEVWKEHGLRSLLEVKVFLYDPGVEEFQKKPSIPADLVICTDVMEHIPENCVDEVLKDIENFSKKAIFFTISTREANKILPNGQNAHVTIKPKEWWLKKINKINKFVITRFSD